jgi:ABC-type polysaccharide/polyol phosphate export permease
VLALLLVLLTVGVVLLLSCANVFFRDVRHLVQLLLTFGIFFTPVFFDAGMFGPRGARLLMLNPLAPILEGMRLVVTQRHDLRRAVDGWHPWHLAYAAVCAVAMLAVGALTFHRAQRRFAEHV